MNWVKVAGLLEGEEENHVRGDRADKGGEEAEIQPDDSDSTELNAPGADVLQKELELFLGIAACTLDQQTPRHAPRHGRCVRLSHVHRQHQHQQEHAVQQLHGREHQHRLVSRGDGVCRVDHRHQEVTEAARDGRIVGGYHVTGNLAQKLVHSPQLADSLPRVRILTSTASGKLDIFVGHVETFIEFLEVIPDNQHEVNEPQTDDHHYAHH